MTNGPLFSFPKSLPPPVWKPLLLLTCGYVTKSDQTGIIQCGLCRLCRQLGTSINSGAVSCVVAVFVLEWQVMLVRWWEAQRLSVEISEVGDCGEDYGLCSP